MNLIDKDTALAALKRAVETQGRDFIYNTEGNEGMCFYSVAAYRSHRPQDYDPASPKAKTGCLIGVTLDLLGVKYNKFEDRSVVNLDGVKERLTFAALEVLRYAQIEQDSGRPWGWAYDAAVRYAAAIDAEAQA